MTTRSLLLFLLLFSLLSRSLAADSQPNVVILFADDLGYGELSCQGNPEIPTPHIDSIAKNGVRFTLHPLKPGRTDAPIKNL